MIFSNICGLLKIFELYYCLSPPPDFQTFLRPSAPSACCTLYGPCWSSPPPCPRQCRWCSTEVMLLDITKFLDPGLLYLLIGNLMAISWPKTQLCQNITSRNNIFNKKNILKCEFIIPPGKSNLFAPFLFIFKFPIQNWIQ